MKLGLLAAVVLAVGAAVARTTWDAQRFGARAAEAEARGEILTACSDHGLVLHRYVPFSGAGARSSEALVRLAGDAAAKGDHLTARACWEDLRSGWLSVRHVFQPGAEWIARAEGALPALYLLDERGTWPPLDLPEGERLAIVRERLQERTDPDGRWAFVLEFGFVSWIGGAVLAIVRGLPADDAGPIDGRALLRWGLCSATGWLLFLLGAARA